ncbi:MAG: O-antigen ligase family protein [Candidatus Omnitrophica bacterium]|nr:O-antigen ligase family protein [Candidatus Omnitrophota bacterium]
MKYFILKITSGEKYKIKIDNPIAKVFPFYFLICLYSLFLGIISEAPVAIMYIEFFFYALSFLIYYAFIDVFADESLIDIFIKLTILISVILSIYGFLVFTFGEKLLINSVTYNSTQRGALDALLITRRTMSSYGDGNVLGAQLVIFCTIIITILFNVKSSLLNKLYLLFAFIINSLCLYLTNSRGALIGFALSLVILLILRFRKLWLLLPVGILVFFFITSQQVSLSETHRFFQKESYEEDIRFSFGDTAKNIVTNAPLGTGFGLNLDDSFNNIEKCDSIWAGYNSFYLQVLGRVGLIGMSLFIFMMFLMLRYFLINLKYISDPLRKNFVFGASIGIICAQISWYSNNVYMLPGGLLNFWFLCAMLTIIVSIEKNKIMKAKSDA